MEADQISKIWDLCINKYKSLPKTGKPTAQEWTILAAIVQLNGKSEEVVSLGLGTKCLGSTKLCSKALALSDSHAEVLARRGFLRYLYNQMELECQKQDSIFEWNEIDAKFVLKNGIKFCFLSTQSPCGDSCIKRDVEIDNELPEKRCKLDNNEENTIFTGAKLIDVSPSDDAMEQTEGALRTKPGKGDKTLCMSCSDKIAKWNILGVQGSLIGLLISKPIYFESMIFDGKSNEHSLKRALYKRFEKHINIHKPNIYIFKSGYFEHAQDDNKQPSPNGLIWSKVNQKLR